jgi:hypothetical protein
MGNRLTIVIEVSPVVRPELNDPHVVAEEVLDTYNDVAENYGYGSVKFIAAEWGHQLQLPHIPT